MSLEEEYAAYLASKSHDEMVEALVREAGRKARNEWERQNPASTFDCLFAKGRYIQELNEMVPVVCAAEEAERKRLSSL